MSKTGFKTYCKIIHYIEEKNPELAELLKHTCTDGILSSTRGKQGITFLMPDRALTEEIKKLAVSDKPEVADRAAQMLAALILRNVYRDPGSFKRPGEVVANCLFEPQVVKVTDVDQAGKKVKFDKGGVATLATDFVVRGDESKKNVPRIAVWHYSGPHYGIDNPAAPKVERFQRKEGMKKGSYEPEPSRVRGIRFKVMLAVEQEYVHGILSCGILGGFRNAYCEASLSLLKYLKEHKRDLYSEILSIIAFDNLDFYLLVQPHNNDGVYLIDDDVISAWAAIHHSQKNINVMSLKKEIQSDMENGQLPGAVFANCAKVLKAIDSAREHATNALNTSFRSCVPHIERIYHELEENNKIGEVSDVFPPMIAAHFKSNPGLKMLYDDLRYISYIRFSKLENSAHHFDFGEFNALVNFIGDALHCTSGENRSKARCMLNQNKIKYMIAPNMERDEALCFVNSTMFLCVPVTPKCHPYLGKNVTVKPRPGKIGAVYNIHGAIDKQYDHMAAAAFTDLTNQITWMDEAQRKELMAKLTQFGTY